MRKIFGKVFYFLFYLSLLLVVIFFLIPKFKKQNHEAPDLKIIPTKKPVKKMSSIFVPSWAKWKEEEGFDKYDRVIYFGVEAGKDGIQNSESRIISLSAFAKASADKDKWLTIIMTNSDVNTAIFKDASSWSKITSNSIKIAKENNFQGIVLDLEMSAIPFSRTVNEIVDFNKNFYEEVKKAGLQYGFLVYGDTFYRKRPYYLPEISKFADEIMIMAYDFHKKQGEPGPNFPLSGKEKFGYDFQTMISDFLASIPPDRLTIIFGMYGYDWQVDEKRLPINQAKALTLAQIKKQFIEKCEWKSCVVKRDDLSKETEIDYVKSWVVNEFGYMDYHIVWFEDEESVRVKTKYLEEKGIGSVGYWAWGYF